MLGDDGDLDHDYDNSSSWVHDIDVASNTIPRTVGLLGLGQQSYRCSRSNNDYYRIRHY